jgi:preprotein translocase subunit SecB
MKGKTYKALHAIQLVQVRTSEMYIRLNGPIEDEAVSGIFEQLEIASAHSKFDEEHRQIHVGMRCSVGMGEENDLPISIRVEVAGTFKVDVEKFPVDQLDHWADNNATAILYPFVREHVFSLTTRCGLPQAHLPLIQVPTIQSKEKAEDE